MSNQPDFAAIIVAAGTGSRTGLSIPKQFLPLGGKPVLRWSFDAFAAHPRCRQIIVVGSDPAAIAAALPHCSYDFAPGGATRHLSVASGLAMVGNHPLVMVHDAARPGLRVDVLQRLLNAVAVPDEGCSAADAAIPAVPVADTLVRASADMFGQLVDRDHLLRVQTPQCFTTSRLRAAHAAAQGNSATDDAQLVHAAGGIVRIVTGDELLEKITVADDIARLASRIGGAAAAVAPAALVRSGTGFDVHRLVDGDGIWLCGIFIPHSRTLLGHSDADVGLHAITDALLGAVGAPDIGDHFPPSNPRWKGAASELFLEHAADLCRKAGFLISSVDCTIICEQPRVGPHKDNMRRKVAKILSLDVSAISIKATTTETLGFTGRGEGIAAQALVTVRSQ